ncbi:TMEM175 family protein [Streptomyces hirsutus]|uniref:TMEM175 family protein n=1 Tax=Streptomyces hirsutus TaxID=35620 RepID=A0ABZ1GX98_9ACTN|nr:TMEM175 family protein [Streptomyces hirsutus]WSD10689.1 TMEM175 family protein [Streptomyces hirsutus]WTD15964.1 TMEM175 family protein [Streptomyces hirsutus]WTD73299.1 TMEM175 family protein [Streptomyces sp. NBC_01635]
MPTERMEAFSDGVIAILITVMVLELPTPHGTTWAALHDALPVLLTYVLSFVYLGIYWNNHHHMLQATDRVNGLILWANLHLLFWLSLIPFTTAWMGQNHFAAVPTAAYGIDLLAAALAYYALQKTITRDQGEESLLATAVGRDLKGKVSPLLYASGIGLSFLNDWLAVAVYAGVALMWLVPDRRLERTIDRRPTPGPGESAP